MRKKVFRVIDVLGTLLNLGLLGFFMWGTATYAPDSQVTVFIWFIAACVALYFVFELIYRINNIFINRDIQRYIDSGFNPASVRRNYR